MYLSLSLYIYIYIIHIIHTRLFSYPPPSSAKLASRTFGISQAGSLHASAQLLWSIAETAVFPGKMNNQKECGVIIAEIREDGESTQKLRGKIPKSWLVGGGARGPASPTAPPC